MQVVQHFQFKRLLLFRRLLQGDGIVFCKLAVSVQDHCWCRLLWIEVKFATSEQITKRLSILRLTVPSLIFSLFSLWDLAKVHHVGRSSWRWNKFWSRFRPCHDEICVRLMTYSHGWKGCVPGHDGAASREQEKSKSHTHVC